MTLSGCAPILLTIRPLGYERVHLPLGKVADTPFHIQGDEFIVDIKIYGLLTHHNCNGLTYCTLYKIFHASVEAGMTRALRTLY